MLLVSMVSTRNSEKKKRGAEEALFNAAFDSSDDTDSVASIESFSIDLGTEDSDDNNLRLKMKKSRKRKIIHFDDDQNYESEQSRDLLKDSTSFESISHKDLKTSIMFHFIN